MSRVSNALIALSTVLLFTVFSGCVLSPKETKYVYITEPGVPSVTVLTPADGSGYHSASATVCGTASVDSPNTIAKVRVKINNGSYVDAAGTTSWTNSGVAFTNGINTIYAIAISDADKTNSPVTSTIYYDSTTASTNNDTYTPDSGWGLVWSDEFGGNSLNTAYWTYQIGIGQNNDGWGNNELEYYTGRDQNLWVDNGCLVIKAIKESYGGKNYTSARINSLGKFSRQYGKFAARIKMPYGQGIWPAFWMMGNSGGTWPACGEIDIVEMVGGNAVDRDDSAHGTIHWRNSSASTTWPTYYSSTGTHTNMPSAQKLFASYHVYEVEWNSSTITWKMDGNTFYSTSDNAADQTEFHQPFYFLINLAVGGNWPGSPDGTTVFPQYMFVDWVRVYTN